MRDGLGRAHTVLVIGGTSGIGLATAAALLEDGARTVVLAGRDPDRLSAAATTLSRPVRPVTVSIAPYDATDPPKAVTALLEQTAADVGDLDVILVCVGTLPDQSRLDTDTDATEVALHTNLLAPAIVAHAAANHLARQGHGRLVVLSSVAAERPRRSLFTYGAAKAGLDAFCLGLADMTRGTGAGVLVVRPGHVRTAMTRGLPEPPLTVDAEQVAAAIVTGLHRTAELIWVPAALRPVMSGLRHLPRSVFRRLPLSGAPR